MERSPVVPAADAGWADTARVFEQPGDPATCWCQWFRLANRDFEAATDDGRREALRVEVLAGAPGPGLVAYRDGEPAGWCGVAPRSGFPRLLRSTLLRGLADPGPGVWALTCFVTRPEHRRRGIAAELLTAAIGHAREHGATVLEGYPVDPAGRSRVSAASLYHGTVALFTAAGFEVVARPSAGRAVVRLAL